MKQLLHLLQWHGTVFLKIEALPYTTKHFKTKRLHGNLQQYKLLLYNATNNSSIILILSLSPVLHTISQKTNKRLTYRNTINQYRRSRKYNKIILMFLISKLPPLGKSWCSKLQYRIVNLRSILDFLCRRFQEANDTIVMSFTHHKLTDNVF